MILVAQDLEGLQTGTGTVFSASLFLKGYKYIASVKGINYDSSNTHLLSQQRNVNTILN